MQRESCMSKKLIIYHAACTDGFAAAYAAWELYGNQAEYYPAHYKSPPPDVAGKDVWLVDFSYPRETLEQMNNQAHKLVVIDHHKTAQENLKGFPNTIFDMSKSGAVLAWEYFHPSVEVPMFFKYIQDRDLWKWKLPDSKYFSVGLESYPFDFEIWHELINGSLLKIIEEGRIIEPYKQKIINDICRLSFNVNFKGPDKMYKISAVNTCKFQSEVCNKLAVGKPFSAAYFRRKDGRLSWSLRSDNNDPNAIDVSKIAASYGGGGHKNAAGFETLSEQEVITILL